MERTKKEKLGTKKERKKEGEIKKRKFDGK